MVYAITKGGSVLETIETLESEVRSYCRSFPTVFEKSEGSYLYDTNGKAYLDFFSGAGALNYGHNNKRMQEKLLEYIAGNGITHSLDMATRAKVELLEAFNEIILKPRNMAFKVQFPGPTGTNSVEAALKLARKITGRHKIVSFTNAFHGMTLGALSISGNRFKREGAGLELTYGMSMPFDGYFGDETDSIDYMDALLQDSGSGVDLPAAAIVETIQAESGINVASFEWLKRLEGICRKYDMLFIIDDVQVGCGRTGPFFSYEPAGVSPDIVCLSKSISGYGLPMALTLIKPELDQWQPGEHNATFRGHNLAFVTAKEALNYWRTDDFSRETKEKGELVRSMLEEIAGEHGLAVSDVRGRGMIQGIAFAEEGIAVAVCRAAFREGLIAETSGPLSDVVKIIPPLTTERSQLVEGLEILKGAIAETLGNGVTAETDSRPAL